MVGGLLLVPLVSWLTPRKLRLPAEDVDGMFACYDREVPIKVTGALGK